ncbi:hypothetical protein BJV82DRAFT_618286 [Fennellomyces sp. T-0311]|nr:hypothetical protein BJV82DRAFT_618286 [Fennellomyces sp. T-0311]
MIIRRNLGFYVWLMSTVTMSSTDVSFQIHFLGGGLTCTPNFIQSNTTSTTQQSNTNSADKTANDVTVEDTLKETQATQYQTYTAVASKRRGGNRKKQAELYTPLQQFALTDVGT